MIVNSAVLDLNIENWKQAFQHIAEQASYHTPLKAQDLYTHLIDMEREQTSGIGGGIAIPHSVVEVLKDPFLLIARNSKKIDMDTVDGEPVDLFALLLSPQKDGGVHLQRLSRITRLLQNNDVKENLRSASSESQLYNMVNLPLTAQEAA